MTVSRRRVVIAGGAVIAAALLGLGLFRPASKSRAGGVGPEPGQVAPLFSSFDLTNHPVALASFRGRPVILNFWASWCFPCRAEFPVLKRLKAGHPDLVVLGVVFQDGESSARDFMQSKGATWPGVRDPDGQIASAYRIGQKPGIPVSVLVDSGGRVRARHLGQLTSPSAAEAFLAS